MELETPKDIITFEYHLDLYGKKLMVTIENGVERISVSKTITLRIPDCLMHSTETPLYNFFKNSVILILLTPTQDEDESGVPMEVDKFAGKWTVDMVNESLRTITHKSTFTKAYEPDYPIVLQKVTYFIVRKHSDQEDVPSYTVSEGFHSRLHKSFTGTNDLNITLFCFDKACEYGHNHINPTMMSLDDFTKKYYIDPQARDTNNCRLELIWVNEHEVSKITSNAGKISMEFTKVHPLALAEEKKRKAENFKTFYDQKAQRTKYNAETALLDPLQKISYKNVLDGLSKISLSKEDIFKFKEIQKELDDLIPKSSGLSKVESLEKSLSTGKKLLEFIKFNLTASLSPEDVKTLTMRYTSLLNKHLKSINADARTFHWIMQEPEPCHRERCLCKTPPQPFLFGGERIPCTTQPLKKKEDAEAERKMEKKKWDFSDPHQTKHFAEKFCKPESSDEDESEVLPFDGFNIKTEEKRKGKQREVLVEEVPAVKREQGEAPPSTSGPPQKEIKTDTVTLEELEMNMAQLSVLLDSDEYYMVESQFEREASGENDWDFVDE